MKPAQRVNPVLASLLAAVGVGVVMLALLPAGAEPELRRAAPAPGEGQGETPVDAATLVAVYGVEEEIAHQVAADLVARAHLGFSVDPQLVIDLRTGRLEMAQDMPEIAMTPAEADEFFVRQSLAEDAQILKEQLGVGELSRVYAGQFLDHQGGGMLVVQAATEEGAEEIEAALDGDLGRSLPHRERVEVRVVAVSRRNLLAARDAVMAKADEEGDGSAVTGALIEDSSNEVVLFVAPGTPAGVVARWDEAMQEQGVPYRIEERAPFE